MSTGQNTVALTLNVASSIMDQLAKHAKKEGISLHEYVTRIMQKAAQGDTSQGASRERKERNSDEKKP